MRRKPRPGGATQFEAQVAAVGAHGDGVAQVELELDWQLHSLQAYLPLTLPGERVLARTAGAPIKGGIRAEVIELLEASPQRVEPACPHFGACGGCQLQHWSTDAYQDWKQARVLDAVTKAGGNVDLVRPLIQTPLASRRRARIVIGQMASGGKISVGLRQRSEHRIEPIDGCQVLRPELMAALAPLEAIAPVLLAKGEDNKRTRKRQDKRGKHSTRREAAVHLEVAMNLAENGLCLGLVSPNEPTLDQRLSLTDLGKQLDAAQISWNGEPLYQPRTPVVKLGKALVPLPANAFLQPSVEGQQALSQLVLDAVPVDADLVADLYGGLGTFSFPLAERGHEVLAVESMEAPIQSLEAARRQDEAYAKLSGAVRDLESWPISAEDLGDFDAVVFDPPRAGAFKQAKAIAQSRVPTVVAVSCNPSTFTRDAQTLIEGGYRLEWVQGVDQFTWTGHVELVAKFSK